MIEYEEEWLFPLLFKAEGSVAVRASMFAIPSAILAAVIVYMEEWQPGSHDAFGLRDLSGSHVWNAITSFTMLLLTFRTKTAFSRFWEGTGLLHQMRGEWFDTVSNCVTFSIASKPEMPDAVTSFRHTLVRLMSLCHGSALEEISDNQVAVDVIDIAGLDFSTLSHLQECDQVHGFNKVEVMLHLVQSLITKARDDGVLKTPPPILSRVYQTISRGFVNLLNAKKITDTKFPFPYAQLIVTLLSLLVILTPIMIGQKVRNKFIASLLTFIPIFGMYSVNFIAMELENPFGIDANDLPLEHFQDEMNRCLLMLLHPNTDMLSGLSPKCIQDFDVMLEAHLNPIEEAFRPRLSTYDTTRWDRICLGEDPDADPRELPNEGFTSGCTSGSVEPEDAYIQRLECWPDGASSSEALRLLKEEEGIRLEAAQREVERRMGEFYLALQRWTLMIESQVKQIREILETLRLLSESAEVANSGGWEHAIHAV